MSAVKKLKQIILNECENYEEEEIFDYNSFVDKFYDDYFFEGIITIYNDSGEIYFNNVMDAVTYLEESIADSYKVKVQYSAVEHLDEITGTIYDALTNETNFTDEECSEIISFLTEDFLNTYKFISNIDEETLEIIDLITSTDDIESLFYEDENVNGVLLSCYIEGVIKEKDLDEYDQIIEEIPFQVNDTKIEIYRDINTFTRNLLLSLYDYLIEEDYKDKDADAFLISYLKLDLSLSRFNNNLFQDIYGGIEESEKDLKKYMLAIVIYDFYQSVYTKHVKYVKDVKAVKAVKDVNKFLTPPTFLETLYLDFIERHNLNDCMTLFKNDPEFNKLAIEHFIIYNTFEKSDSKNYDLDESIYNKFAPISSIEKLSRKIQN